MTLFSNFFIKNGSHSTIYTFKKYFATVFLVSAKISCIQTDRVARFVKLLLLILLWIMFICFFFFFFLKKKLLVLIINIKIQFLEIACFSKKKFFFKKREEKSQIILKPIGRLPLGGKTLINFLTR